MIEKPEEWDGPRINQLGWRLLDGPEDIDWIELTSYRSSFVPALREIVGMVEAATAIVAVVRPAKPLSSVLNTMVRDEISLSQVADMAGCRLVVPDLPSQGQVVERMKMLFPRARIRDLRRRAGTLGYRAVHFYPVVAGRKVEVQVMTELQSLWSESLYRLSIETESRLLPRSPGSEMHALLADMSLTVAHLERLRGRLAVREDLRPRRGLEVIILLDQVKDFSVRLTREFSSVTEQNRILIGR